MPKFLDDVYIQRNGHIENLSQSISRNQDDIEKLRRTGQHNVFIRNSDNSASVSISILEVATDNKLVSPYRDLDDFLDRSTNALAFQSYPCIAWDRIGIIFNLTTIIKQSMYGSIIFEGYGYKFTPSVEVSGETGKLISETGQLNIVLNDSALTPLSFNDTITYPLYF